MAADSIDGLLTDARKRLAAAPFAPSTREATLLLARLMDLDEAQVLARPAEPLPEEIAREFRRLLDRRLEGEPVAYLLGEKEFYGRSFRVDRRVLIPRPETEHLVETALALTLPPAPRILDIGTGSACLAVTLALEIPGSRALAIDVELGALAVARSNIERHRVSRRVRPLAGDLAPCLDLAGIDLVVSNPPYIGPEELDGLSPEISRFEPHRALLDPFDEEPVVSRMLGQLSGLRSGVSLVLEIGLGQKERVRHQASEAGFEPREIVADYAGIPRIVVLVRR